MDGHFVPNITLGPNIVKSLRKDVNMVFDAHLNDRKSRSIY